MDTFGGAGTLLTDAEATVSAIGAAFDQLQQSQPDGVMVIAFSGHGTETHELVAP